MEPQPIYRQPIDQVSRDQTKANLRELAKRRSPATMESVHAVLSSVFEEGIDSGLSLAAELEAHVVALKKEGLQAGRGGQVDLLFVKSGGPEGRWPFSQRDVQCELKRVCKAAGLEIRNPHDLRHTYATILLMTGLEAALAGGAGRGACEGKIVPFSVP
jgi:hypothetical protein